MSRWRRAFVLVAAALVGQLLPVPAAHAQGEDPLARALTSYRNLEYDDAAARLRAALAPNAAVRLTDSDRTRAMMHLGATELFRGRREAAVEAFRLLLLADPRYRPDELVFPPEVSALFQETRFSVRAVSVVLPTEVDIRGTSDRLPIRIYASTLHEIRAQVLEPSGVPDRVLHDGAIGDSLELLWNARDFLGRLRDPGRYTLRVSSRSPTGREEREVDIPLEVERIALDSLRAPEALAPSIFRSETAMSTSGVRHLLVGLAAAGAVAALPSVLGGSDEGMGIRFGVAGALSVAGVIGMARSSKPIPLPDNVRWNRQQRDAWAREVERVRLENEARRAQTRLRIRAGKAVTVEIK